MLIDTDQIQKIIKKNCHIIIIIATIIFVYFLFYTDYIIQNSYKLTSNSKQVDMVVPIQMTEQVRMVPTQNIEVSNHVRFDDNKNQEINSIYHQSFLS